MDAQCRVCGTVFETSYVYERHRCTHGGAGSMTQEAENGSAQEQAPKAKRRRKKKPRKDDGPQGNVVTSTETVNDSYDTPTVGDNGGGEQTGNQEGRQVERDESVARAGLRRARSESPGNEEARQAKRAREEEPPASATAHSADNGTHQLASDAEIQSYGLVINSHHGLVICAEPSCEFALTPTAKAIAAHLGKHGRPVREYTIQGWLARHNIPATHRIPAPRCMAVTGIRTVEGVACRVPGCSYACSSLKHLRARHRSADHNELDELPFERVWVQLVYETGSHRRHIEVFRAADAEASGDVCSVLMGHDDRLERERAMLNLSGSVKETSQWLVRSGILAFASRFTQADLLCRAEMTALPQLRSGWLDTAAAAAAAYFDRCIDLLDLRADDVVLRHMRSKGAEADNRPLSRIDNTAKYRGIFVRLVTFVLRNAQNTDDAPFTFSERQASAARDLLHICASRAPSDETLHDAVQSLAFAVFAHDYDGARAHTTALLTFVFLGTLDKYNGYFLPPALVTPLTAALSYAARCVVYAQIVADAAASGSTTFKTMPEHVKWIKVGTPNAFDGLRQVHDLARNISMHTASPDRVFWKSGNRSSFRYLGHNVRIAGIQRMIQAMASRLDQLEASLGKYADLEGPELALPMSPIDDPANVQPGYSFVSEPENGIDRTAYARQLLRSGHFCRFYPGSDGPTWIQSACTQWKEDYIEFSELRATLMHMAAGQPPRGTEALQTLMVNSDRRRSLIFTDEPEMLWVLDYNKSSEMTGGFDRTIIRGLDRHLGDVVKRDVAFMRTFAQVLAESVFHCGTESVLMGYKFLNRGIFGGDISTERVSAVMEKYSSDHLELALKVSDWRHIMTSISRHLITDLDVATTALQADLDYQEGHSSLTAELHYGRERNGLTSRLISRFLPLSRCVHKILKRPLATDAAEIPVEDVDASPDDVGRGPWDTESIVRGVVDGLAPQLRAAKLDTGALADSIMGHIEERVRDLTLTLVAQTGAGIVSELRSHGYLPLYGGNVTRPLAQPAVVLDRKGRDLLSSLRAFLGVPDATWLSPAQGEAMDAIVRHEGHTATFLPTAGGKSMLWQLPCAHFDRATDVTVVYTPWLVLGESGVRAALAAGLAATLWRRENPTFRQLTFVTPETGSEEDFHSGLRELRGQGRLRRFFLDEVHAWVTDSSYRPAMLDGSAISAYAVPIHLLSATVPVDVYNRALAQLGMADLVAPRMFRERSVRMSIRYCVFRLPTASFLGHVTAASSRLLRAASDRGIVFVRSKKEAEYVAEKLRCEAFHSGLAPEDRTAVLKRWEMGEHAMIVATTLLSTGYHVPGVRLVVEYGASWNYISHSQGTGRGGRGDTYCEAHVLFDPQANYNVPNGGDFGHSEMLVCLRDERACLREAMGRYLDGVGERCAVLPLSYVPCSRCAPSYDAPRAGQPIVWREAPVRTAKGEGVERARQAPEVNVLLRMNAELLHLRARERMDADEYLRVRVEMLRKICRGCWLRAGLRCDAHATHECLEADNLVHAAVNTAQGPLNYAALKARVTIEGQLACIWCWVPRTPRLHQLTSTHGSQCAYQDVIPQICLGAWTICHDFLVRCEQFAHITAATTFDQYWSWMASRDSDAVHGNAVRVFLAVSLGLRVNTCYDTPNMLGWDRFPAAALRAVALFLRDDRETAAMLVCTSRRIYDTVEPVLYDDVALTTGAAIAAFYKIVVVRKETNRQPTVRALSVTAPDTTGDFGPMVAVILGRLQGLEILRASCDYIERAFFIGRPKTLYLVGNYGGRARQAQVVPPVERMTNVVLDPFLKCAITPRVLLASAPKLETVTLVLDARTTPLGMVAYRRIRLFVDACRADHVPHVVLVVMCDAGDAPRLEEVKRRTGAPLLEMRIVTAGTSEGVWETVKAGSM